MEQFKKTEEVISFLRSFSRTIRPCKARSEYEFLDLIYNDKIFGLVLCDIETPPEKKEYFSEFCPIFKNVKVTRDDIGEFMESFAEKNNLLSQPRRMLISSFFGKKFC